MATSLLISKGLPVPAVSVRLIYASPHTTVTIYARAIKHQDQQAADMMQDALTSYPAILPPGGFTARKSDACRSPAAF